jgi:phage-related protein
MDSGIRPISLQFWRSAAGREPTRDWFRALDRADREVVGDDLRRVQFGWPVGMPLVRSLGGGLWELRSTLPSKREARVMFSANGERIAVLHGFIKKAQKTPASDLALARKRMKDLIS